MSASIWNPSSTATSPNALGIAFTPTAEILSENVQNAIEEVYAAIPGAAPTYATLALAEAAAFAAGTALTIPKGTYPVAANLTFRIPVIPEYGCRIVPATGVNINFEAGCNAGIYYIVNISAAGSSVTFNPKFQKSGYAEWFGAITGGTTPAQETVNRVAINAAIVALAKVELMPDDYFVDDTIFHLTPNCELAGAGSLWDSVYGLRATRVLVNSASAHCIYVGKTSPGASAPSQYPLGIKIKGISFARTTKPSIPSACSSIYVNCALEAEFYDVRGDESIHGWEFSGTVSCKIIRCSAKRTSDGISGTDTWRGFYINGGSGLFAGGNASLYISYSHADDTRPVKTDSSGFYMDGAFTDTFLDWCETVSCTVGVNIQGLGGGGGLAANTDCRITNQTNDSFASYGILVNNLGSSGCVEIIGGYNGASSTASAAIQYQNSSFGATLTLKGGVCQMSVAPSTIGIQSISASGLIIDGTQIQEADAAAVALSNVTASYIAPVVKNSGAISDAAVQMFNTCTGNKIAPVVVGTSGAAVALGIQVVGTGDGRNTYDIGGMDSSVIAGGYTNKLTRNGVSPIASPTAVPFYSGTNLVTGCAG